MTNERKPDFSKVQGTVRGTEGEVPEKPDFSQVKGTVRGEGIAPESTTHTVEKGDTLSHIAKHYYGRASKWKAIFDANRDILDDPDRIQPGQVLQIPALDADGDGTPGAPH